MQINNRLSYSLFGSRIIASLSVEKIVQTVRHVRGDGNVHGLINDGIRKLQNRKLLTVKTAVDVDRLQYHRKDKTMMAKREIIVIAIRSQGKWLGGKVVLNQSVRNAHASRSTNVFLQGRCIRHGACSSMPRTVSRSLVIDTETNTYAKMKNSPRQLRTSSHTTSSKQIYRKPSMISCEAIFEGFVFYYSCVRRLLSHTAIQMYKSRFQGSSLT